MNWNTLNNVEQIADIDKTSQAHTVLIFKHSTRCSISAMALERLQRKWQTNDYDKLTVYFLDLIQFRDVSNAVAAHYAIEHQSPQVLIIRNGQCIYSETHGGIRYEDIIEHSTLL